MASFTIAPLADYLPKMGKRAQSLLSVGVDATAPEAAQILSVKTAWKSSVESAVRTALAKVITGQLNEIVEEHEMFHGARPEAAPGTPPALLAEWDGELDDAISSSFDDKFWHAVGPSGMVDLSTDTQAHEGAQRIKLAEAMVDQVVANGQYLVLSDDEARLILKANPPSAAAPKEAAAETPKPAVVEHTFEAAWSAGLRIVRGAFKAQTHDALSIYDELDGVIDSDDILSSASAGRLSPTSVPEQVRAIFQAISAVPHPDGWIDHLVMAALDTETPEEAEMARGLAAYDKAEKPRADVMTDIGPATASPVAATRRSPAEQNADDARATQIMCEFVKLSGMTEQTMADIIGVSRAMVNAAVKGKKNVDWTPERVSKLLSAAMDFTTDAATFHETARSLAA